MKRLGLTTCLALGALATPSAPAAAQGLGDLIPGDTVEQTVQDVGGTVQDVVEAPLPGPVEDVVAETPVAPVREEVRRVVRDTVGTVGGGGNGGGGNNGGGNGGGGNGTGSGTGTGTAGGGGSGTAGGGGGSGTAGGGSPGRTRERPRARRGARAGQAGAGTVSGAADGAGDLSTAGASGAGNGSSGAAGEGSAEPDQSAVVQTVDRIVRAIPTPIWVALGVLFGMALSLGGRVFVERRRARALARDREQLQRDVEALERALLPAVPEKVGGVATSVAYRSSDGPAAGGDFYDAFELPDGRAVVLVGDVSGHGADALESTNLVRTHLHALLEDGLSPRAALAEVGRRAPAWLNGRLTTVVVAVHDPVAGTLTYATAGHPAPIVAGPAAVEPITVCGSPPLGVDVPTGLRETVLPLPPGSVACFFTDGLLEARAGDGMVGRERLAELVAELGPDDGADALLALVVDEADAAPDDMAVCLLRPVTGQPVLLSDRIEVLELEAGDLASGVAQRFLEACQVPKAEIEATLDQAAAAVRVHGQVLVEVTLTGDGGRARVATPLILA